MTAVDREPMLNDFEQYAAIDSKPAAPLPIMTAGLERSRSLTMRRIAQ